MSKYEAIVVPIELIPIPEAHSLSLVYVDIYTVVARTEDWVGKKKALYLPPETLVPTDNPLFSFLAVDAKFNRDSFKETGGVYARIKAKKFLKGLVQSYGLLVPVDDSVSIGTDMYEELKLGHYEPEIQSTSQKSNDEISVLQNGENENNPDISFDIPQYKIEGGKYATKIFEEGEPVWISLKYHGENFRAVFANGKMNVGSHYTWKREISTKPQINKEGVIAKYGDKADIRIAELEAKLENWKPGLNKWWTELRMNPWLEEWCKKNPNVVVYGEVIGGVKGFPYGCKPNEKKIVVFDIMKDGQFMDCMDAREFGKDLIWVHDFAKDTPFNLKEIINMVEHMPNVSGNKYEEGIIVRSAKERWNSISGRSIVKFKTPEYLEKS